MACGISIPHIALLLGRLPMMLTYRRYDLGNGYGIDCSTHQAFGGGIVYSVEVVILGLPFEDVLDFVRTPSKDEANVAFQRFARYYK